MIELETIKQHFTSLGWHLCWLKHPILKRFWFEKDGLRTSLFYADGANLTLISIHDIEQYNDSDMRFFDVFSHRLLKGGTDDIEIQLVEWIKEVEVKWGLYRL